MKHKEVKKIMVGLAEYYQTTLTPGQITMYADDLVDLGLEEIAAAIKRIRQNPTITFFPRPSIIRQEIFGSVKDDALEASSRIVQAMSKFGYTNPEKAKLFIGSVGWRVVERDGGWGSICRNVTTESLPIYKAQWRELAASTIRRIKLGIDGAPSLEGPAQFLEIGDKS